MKYKILFLLFCLQILLVGQTNQVETIEPLISMVINNMPGENGNNYKQPTEKQLSIFKRTMLSVLSDPQGLTQKHADSISYKVITIDKYRILFSNINYWGTYIINTDPCRSNLVIQVPHPLYDTNTEKQGIFCFKELDARAFFMAGTHRCNSNSPSQCDGKTTVCSGRNEAFRISDVCHNNLSPFQVATEVLYKKDKELVFIQLHGFDKDRDEPYVIISNGTRIEPKGVDYALSIRNMLDIQDPVLTFKAPHEDLKWNKLNGLTNVQGRLVNKDNDPCDNNATQTSGRFVHIEQEYQRLREDRQDWQKMVNALSQVFPCLIIN